MTAAPDPPCPNPECNGVNSAPWHDDRRRTVAWTCTRCGTTSAPVPCTRKDGSPAPRDIAEARRLWAALPRAPRWTSEPVAEGVYVAADRQFDQVSAAYHYPGRGSTILKPIEDDQPAEGLIYFGPIPTPAGRGERSDDK